MRLHCYPACIFRGQCVRGLWKPSLSLLYSMELRVLAEFERAICSSDNYRTLSPKALSTAITLISNPFTSHTTLRCLFKTLTGTLQNSQSLYSIHHDHILSLLSALFHHHPHIRHDVCLAVREFALAPSTPTPSLARALSILFNNVDVSDDFADESTFLSLCFRPCRASVRHWLLRNVNKFHVRPSVLLTVMLGFTKDPYPFARMAALDGLAFLSKFIAVEDQTLIQGCYFRAVELLFDSEDYVRCSAVRAVSEWGQLIVANNHFKHHSDWSDALFVQLCSMVRDMSVKVRIEAFRALSYIRLVSGDILLQTLSKKASPGIKDKSYPGQHTADLFELPASTAAFAFVHGLEDEFYEVRRSACHALGTLTVLSADFAFEAVNLLVDMLNDDSIAVRLQALETMRHMATSGNLKVQGGHLDMLLGTLVDSSTSIRAAARSVLHLTRLVNSAMFKLCLQGLVKNLEMYPEDEADIFYVLFNIGLHHGKFVAQVIQDAYEEMEPSFGGKLGYENAKTVALLVLAVSAPVSLERSICSIPASIFSYAVTLLGRISHGLAGTLSMNDILVYLSHCSRFAFVSISTFFEGEEPAFPMVKGDMQLWQKSYEFYQKQFEEILKLRKGVQPVLSYQMEAHEAAGKSVKIMLQKVKDVWPFIQCGCLDEVAQTLRSWKKELMNFMSHMLQPIAEVAFTLQYLKILKFLGRMWVYCMFPTMAHSGVGELEILLRKLDRSIRDMRYRFIGLNKEADLHILELIIVSCTLKISCAKAPCSVAALKKLYSAVSCVECLQEGSSLELPSFIVELRKILHEIGLPTNPAVENSFQLQKSLKYFSLGQFDLSGRIKYVEAELEVRKNSYENPLNFISGLPVGIPFEIKLYNIPCESRLWLKMTLGEGETQFVFLDLDGESSHCDEVKQFSFVAPFYGTPKGTYFTLNACIAMECSSEQVSMGNNYWGPQHELMNICREREVYLSRSVK